MARRRRVVDDSGVDHDGPVPVALTETAMGPRITGAHAQNVVEGLRSLPEANLSPRGQPCDTN